MEENRLKKLESLGQAIWLDYIRYDFVVNGGLKDLIETDGLRGMTSNPAIFAKAILDGKIYDRMIQDMLTDGKDAKTIYEMLSQADVRNAADIFRSVYDKTDGTDGYVSLEVNPHLAHDTEGTIEEALRLWAALDRKNVMIKIPATTEGLPAIRRLIAEGININVTLIFGVTRYLQVVDEFIAGIQERIAQNKPVKNVASVASFFLSRIDTMVDPVLENKIRQGGDHAQLAKSAFGQVAIACAKTAYKNYQRIFEHEPFTEMITKGANVQRLLWASTGAKNPQFSELKYVEPIIGKNTVNTLPVETFQAYRAHGIPTLSIENEVAQAEEVLKSLPVLGIDLEDVANRLETEGVEKFIEPFDRLMSSIENFSNMIK